MRSNTKIRDYTFNLYPFYAPPPDFRLPKSLPQTNHPTTGSKIVAFDSCFIIESYLIPTTQKYKLRVGM